MSFSSVCDEFSESTFKINKIKSDDFTDKNENFDWDKINCRLKINGFPELSLKFNEKDELYFDNNGTISLRYLLSDLLSKSTRSQELVKDLLNDNDKLKSHLKDNEFVIKRYEETIRNLNESLLETKQRFKEVSNSQRNSLYEMNDNKDNMDKLDKSQETEQSRQIVITRYYNLQQICDEQRQEINVLQMKINKLTSVEESRRNRQRDIFHQLRNKAPNTYNALDKRLLDIIDSYESKVLQLESHMMFFSNLGFALPDDDMENHLIQTNNNNYFPSHSVRLEVSEEYKQVIVKLQEEIHSIQRRNEALEEKYELLKLESNSKPSLQELKDVITKLKEYKQVLTYHNIRPERDRITRKSHLKNDGQFDQYPDKIEDIEFLPLKTCQRYLVKLCLRLSASSVTEVFKSLSELLEINSVFPMYASLFTRLSQLVRTPGLPILMECPTYDSLEPQTIETTHAELIDILELWVHQLCSTNQLYNLVEQLHSVLLPWTKSLSTVRRPAIHGVIDILNEVLDRCEIKEDVPETIKPTLGQYKGLVEHFQNLFECPNVIGVYSKMNVVYSKYTEMVNVLDTLKKIIRIEDQRGLACLVAEVDSLVEISNFQFNKDLSNFGMTKDIETLVSKLETYEEFVPQFEDLVSQITDLLGISSIDEILPRVKCLQASLNLLHQ